MVNISEAVEILENALDKIDELMRTIELAPKHVRANLRYIHEELNEIRGLIVDARMKIVRSVKIEART